jgi:nucleoside phosphorylase
LEDNLITIHQAFYGEVNRAHSCIKQTFSDTDLTSFLNAFTDRPAALPPGVSLLPYLSGTPYFKYYLLTKTFADLSATRAGMVFSHVLIFKLEDIARINNLGAVLSHFVESTENKVEELQVLQIKINDGTGNLANKHQPKYIQEIISAYLSGVSPILFSGSISAFSDALQYIWNFPNTSLRKKIKFRTSFTLADIEHVSDLTIVSIQKDFLSKWHGQKIIVADTEKSVEINSLSELLFLGEREGNPLYNFLVELNVNLEEVQSYSQYDRIFTNYISLNKIEDANILRQDIRALTRISPSSKDGVKIKEKFLAQLSTLIYQKKDKNIKALRNIDWSTLPNGQVIAQQIVSSFINSELENKNQKDFESLSELVHLSVSEDEQNWWHTTIKKSFTQEFKKGNDVSLRNIWYLIEYSKITSQNLLTLFSVIKNCDQIIRKTIPENLSSNTSEYLLEISTENGWYLLHADILRKQYSIELSIEKQLQLEQMLPLQDSVGVKYLAQKITYEQLIELTLKTGDSKLVMLSVEAIEKNSLLLKDLDLSVSTWLNIWTRYVSKTKNVFSGLAGNEKRIVFTIMDLLLKGENISQIIIALIADSPFSDLSDYKNRREIWKIIDKVYKDKFLNSTSQKVFEQVIAGDIQKGSIESDILDQITSDSFITNFLNKSKRHIEPVIAAFTVFNNLEDGFLADYVSYFNGDISLQQSKRLGEVIVGKKLSKSARAIFEKAKYNSSFVPALEICREFVNLNFWDSIWASRNFTKDEFRPMTNTAPFPNKEKDSKHNLPTVVILTAINEEYLAVREHLKDILDADQNDTNYEVGIFEIRGKEIAKVFIRECGAKNTTAAQETERAIQYFKPDLMFFVGIAGSRKPNDFSIGDVIFPIKVYSYEGGKSEKNSFVARPEIAAITYTLKEIAKKERRKNDWKDLVIGSWPKDFKADLGVIASGEQVVEHYNSEIGKILLKNYNDTSAVEMEGFGFAHAANMQGRGTSNILIGIVRGISDIIEQPSKVEGDNNTDRRPTNAKTFASATASAFAFWLIFQACKTL